MRVRRRKFDLSLPQLKAVRRSVPIPTVDFVVVRRNDAQREFLLGRRNDKPYRGKWFVAGGRVQKGEKLEVALRRQCQREFGVKPKNSKFVGCFTVFNPPDNFGIRWHAITHIYLVNIGDQQPQKTADNKSVRWFNKINPLWPSPVKKMLRLAGFK